MEAVFYHFLDLNLVRKEDYTSYIYEKGKEEIADNENVLMDRILH